ncbi:glycosyltransferase [Lactobacillus sp. DCY120]|uniref:Glycosyltransferase n=1 Tax=Bombilactobacillus apium TaxID=2675299 RepID=A0A850RAU7_9LACO|nr:glycosyltransferase [Bombilactobacillus apium]NVY96446.1 glycosyltransferase [Bombilactobacillus apium]
MPKLSIIIPLYNEAGHLMKNLQSLLAQTNPDFEVILVDDGSTDQTNALASSWVQEHSQFRLLTLPSNQGISSARNAGIKEAQGELITFIDGDDWVEPNYTDFFLRCFTYYHLDLAVCGYIKEPPKKNAKIPTTTIQGFCDQAEVIRQITKMSGSVMGYTWNKVYRTDLIRKYQLEFDPDISLMEDQIFNVQYAVHAQNFYIQSPPLYHYWQHEDSASHTHDLESAKSIGLANYRIAKIILANKKSSSNSNSPSDYDFS